MRRIPNLFFIIESLRLVAWISLMVWFAVRATGDTYQNELIIESIYYVMYLGFPYSWSASMLFGTWDLVEFGSDVPFRIVVVHFLIWLLISTIIAWVLGRWGKD